MCCISVEERERRVREGVQVEEHHTVGNPASEWKRKNFYLKIKSNNRSQEESTCGQASSFSLHREEEPHLVLGSQEISTTLVFQLRKK